MVTCTSPFRRTASYAALSSGARGVPKELLHVAVVPARAKATEAGVGVLAPRPEPHQMAEFDPSGIDYHGHCAVANAKPPLSPSASPLGPSWRPCGYRPSSSWLRRRPT